MCHKQPPYYNLRRAVPCAVPLYRYVCEPCTEQPGLIRARMRMILIRALITGGYMGLLEVRALGYKARIMEGLWRFCATCI